MSQQSPESTQARIFTPEGRQQAALVVAGLVLAATAGLVGATVHDFTDGPIASFDSSSILNDGQPSSSK